MKVTPLSGMSTHSYDSKEEFLEYINNKQAILIAINTEKILSNNKQLKEIVNENIGYPDGIGAVMALKRKGINAIKTPGAQLWLDIIRKYNSEKTFYLIGSTKEIIERTVQKLKTEFPGIRIKNYKNGYFDDTELEEIKNDIKMKKPDIVFVGIGSPRQEFIMADLIKDHSALYMGLGGSFDLYCGIVKPVPDWWKKHFKWEALYRSFNDIKNLKRWKRLLLTLRILHKVVINRI